MTRGDDTGTRRGRKRASRKQIPEGVRTALQAEVLEGGRTTRQLAAAYGVTHRTVQVVTRQLDGLDVERVAAIRRRTPELLAVLAAAHAGQALKTVESDPASSVKSTFGAKLAVEAARWSTPGAAAPGAVMLAFIETMNVGKGPAAGPGVEAEGVAPLDVGRLEAAADLAELVRDGTATEGTDAAGAD